MARACIVTLVLVLGCGGDGGSFDAATIDAPTLADATGDASATDARTDAATIDATTIDAPPPDAPVADAVIDGPPPFSCTDAIGCKEIDGKWIFKVPAGGAQGATVCANHGLTCVSAPVFSPPEKACLAFNPGLPVTTKVKGWRQAIRCNNQSGICAGLFSCHHCPVCAPNISCTNSVFSGVDEAYVECAP